MAVIPLSGTRRLALGKGGARKARAAGHIPAVLYGHGEEPVAVSVQAREFDLALRGHKGSNPIVNLAMSGGEYTALVRAVQYDPISHAILHLDFQHISLTETIEVSVAVHLVGLPVGVKDGGGILETIQREIEVRCLPTAIPAFIEVDVSRLNIGDSVHVREISVPTRSRTRKALRSSPSLPGVTDMVRPARKTRRLCPRGSGTARRRR